jgi:hypothetical protein
MAEIVLNVPDDMPLPGLISRLNALIAQEHLQWILFTKSTDEISIDSRELDAFEDLRARTWNEKKSDYGL